MYFTFSEKWFIIIIVPREQTKEVKNMKKLSVMLQSYYHMFG